jgi:hypothetical protein
MTLCQHRTHCKMASQFQRGEVSVGNFISALLTTENAMLMRKAPNVRGALGRKPQKISVWVRPL